MKDKLLILDDEPLILSSIAELFEDDYDVLTASNAGAALDELMRHEVAVVLTDERMPGLTGHEFLHRAREASKAIRIMISGYADINALTDAVNCGRIFAYVAKPWNPGELKGVVASAIVHFNLVRAIDHERELLRVLMENVPDLIYFKDRDSLFTRVNSEQARALGAGSAADCIGKRETHYLDSEYARRSFDDEREIVRTGSASIDRVEKMRMPGGRDRWMSITRVPIRDKAGFVTGIAGISRDITRLKDVEETLREKIEHHRLIIETANDAFISLDAAGSIVAWNRQAEIIFGWTAKEAVGRPLADTIVPPSGKHVHPEPFPNLSNPNGRIEINLVRRSGVEFPVELTAWAVREGGAHSWNLFVRDITERRSAQAALSKESALVQLLQAVTVAANESSTIGQAAQTCLDRICNHIHWPLGHFLRVTHGTVPQLVSAKLWHVEEGRRFTAFREATGSRAFAGGEGLPGKVLESGNAEWIVDVLASEDCGRQAAALQAGLRSAFGFPILVKGKVMGVLEFFSLETAQPDIAFVEILTHIGSQLGEVIVRQDAQEDLTRAKVSAESSNRAKSEFLNTISHEIRTPMNAILGMANLLSETSLTPEQQNYIGIFKRGGVTLLSLINDLLDLSKVESGHCELERVDFNLLSVLEKTIELMLSPARAKGLRLTSEVLPDVPLMLLGDPDRLRQILINLIGNALKFTERGSIAVRVAQDLVVGESRSLRFVVTDTGIGIAPEKLEMIFGSFTQADSSTTRNYGGTGLGLAICKGLVELMGGQIGCTSELGRGSEFSFTIPFRTPEERHPLQPIAQVESDRGRAVAPVDPQAGTSARGTRILIVEDNKDNLALIKAYFKNSAFDLDSATNGKIAVEKVVSCNYDIVLMDVQMPVMDGHEATRAIRGWEQRTGSGPIPILALTAHASQEDVEKSEKAGCTEHLTKPIEKDVLLDAIARYSVRRLPKSG